MRKEVTRIEDFKPIVLKEKDYPTTYPCLMRGNDWQLRHHFLTATENALGVMLESGLTLVPDRLAAWSSHIFYQHNDHFGFKDLVGEKFPSEDFSKSCSLFCEEKVSRMTRNRNHISSHESRDPSRNEWGGAAELCFQLISLTGTYSILVCSGACSGLKEWEDLALELGKYRYLGLIKFQDEQIQELLRRADESVKDDPTGQPEGMTVTGYVKKVFAAIDDSLKGTLA